MLTGSVNNYYLLAYRLLPLLILYDASVSHWGVYGHLLISSKILKIVTVTVLVVLTILTGIKAYRQRHQQPEDFSDLTKNLLVESNDLRVGYTIFLVMLQVVVVAVKYLRLRVTGFRELT